MHFAVFRKKGVNKLYFLTWSGFYHELLVRESDCAKLKKIYWDTAHDADEVKHIVLPFGTKDEEYLLVTLKISASNKKAYIKKVWESAQAAFLVNHRDEAS